MESDTNASHVTQVPSATLVDTTSASMLTLLNTANILNNSNDLESDGSLYIENLKQQTVRAMIPAMSYLILISLIGLVGNSLVLLVYSGKFKQTSTRIFILAIASFDIVTNIVAIPGENCSVDYIHYMYMCFILISVAYNVGCITLTELFV